MAFPICFGRAASGFAESAVKEEWIEKSRESVPMIHAKGRDAAVAEINGSPT